MREIRPSSSYPTTFTMNTEQSLNSSRPAAIDDSHAAQIEIIPSNTEDNEQPVVKIIWKLKVPGSNSNRRVEHSLGPTAVSAGLVYGFYPQPNDSCQGAPLHRIGVFCFGCRGILTPWGNAPPIARDGEGQIINTPPKGALLEGIKDLHNSYEVAFLGILVYLYMQRQVHEFVPNLVEAVAKHAHLPDIACRILLLAGELQAASHGKGSLPTCFEILVDALRLPTITKDEYLQRVVDIWSTQTTPHGRPQTLPGLAPQERLSHYLTSPTEALSAYATLHGDSQALRLVNLMKDFASKGPGFVQYAICKLDWERLCGHMQGLSWPQMTTGFRDRYEAAKIQATQFPDYKSFNSNSQPNSTSFAGPGSVDRAPKIPENPKNQSFTQITGRNTNADAHAHAHAHAHGHEHNNVQGPNKANVPQFIGVSRTKIPLHGCATTTTYRFVQGTDLSGTVVGVPDPGKFYFTCENPIDSEDIEAYQYNKIAGFNWNDSDHIDRLNDARMRLQTRIFGLPWTVMEKEALKEEIEEAIKAGSNKNNIKWEDIARNMMFRFKDVTQPKGGELALCSDQEDGNEDKGISAPFLLQFICSRSMKLLSFLTCSVSHEN
jgi:hypothetical protein